MVIDIKTRQTVVEPDEEVDVLELPTPEFILKKCLETAHVIDQIIVMTLDNNGKLGFLGNCDGFAESLLFMDLIKAQALKSRIDNTSGGNGAA